MRASVGPETKIIGFTIQNGEDGILAFGKLHILNNRFINNRDAIDYESGGGICRDNVFENNADDAIDLDGPTEAVIEDNIIRNNGDDGIGIRLHNYSGPTLNIIIRNNIISGNEEDGIQLIDYSELSDRFFLIERNLIERNAMVGLGLMDGGETTEDFRAASIPERIHLFNNTFTGNDYAVTGGDNLIALNNLFVNSTTLALAGYTDWRIPNIKELQSIVDYGRCALSIGDDCTDQAAINPIFGPTAPTLHWSSTTVAGGRSSTAWIVNFIYCTARSTTAKISRYVCVRCEMGGD